MIRLERGGWSLTVRGAPEGGAEAMAARFEAGGLAVIAGTPGPWSLVADRGERRLVAVDAFAGEPLFLRGRDVVDPGEVWAEVDPRMVGQHLDAELTDPTVTWWKGVSRVPGGFGGPPGALHRIWQPGTAPFGDPVLALRSTLEGLTIPAGTLALSGGLDSSALAALGHFDGAVRNAFPGWACDEAAPARAVAKHNHLSLVDVDSTRLGPADVFDVFQPPVFPAVLVNHYLNRALLEASSGDLITGFGGDELVGHGSGALQTWADAGQLGRVWREAALLALRERIRPSTSAERAHRYLRAATALTLGRRGTDPRERRWRTLTHPLLQRSREEQAQVGRTVGRRIHQPLLDPRLAALNLAIPDTARVEAGRTRAHLRRALADRLPPQVRERPDKADLRRAFDEPFADLLPSIWPVLVGGSLDPWRSSSDLRALRTAFEAGDHLAGAALWRAFGAARWLSWHAARARRPV